MISYDPGADIRTDQAQLLVNTVNTVGVMGAGVAKAVRLRYPDYRTGLAALLDASSD